MKSLRKFENYLISFDSYGTSIGIHYKGQGSYKTRLGSFCSLVVKVLIYINMVNLITAFLDGSNQKESAQTLKYETFGGEAQYLHDLSFGIQIIVEPPLPERIGTFDLYQVVDHSYDTKIPLEKCSEES